MQVPKQMGIYVCCLGSVAILQTQPYIYQGSIIVSTELNYVYIVLVT